MLYVLYQERGLAAPEVLDRLYPEFVWNYLPPVISGIVIAAIIAAAMANIAAALNSLASTTIMDFLMPLAGDNKKPEEHYLKLSRLATLFWGGVLLAIAIMARHWGSVLEAGLAIASIPLGALLGVFSLGVLTRRVSETAAIGGMLAGLAMILYVRFGTDIAWTWYVVVGSVTTFLAGWALGLLLPPQIEPKPGASGQSG
jgi:Na+/proline symporter